MSCIWKTYFNLGILNPDQGRGLSIILELAGDVASQVLTEVLNQTQQFNKLSGRFLPTIMFEKYQPKP